MSIIDCTLRDGEQSPAVYLALYDKIRLCSYLQDLGIREVEIGTPALGVEERTEIRKLLQLQFNFEALAWCRARKSDLQDALECGCRRVHIAIPISDIQLSTLGVLWEDVPNLIFPVLQYAQKNFDFVSVGAQDASRCPQSRLLDFAVMLQEHHVDRLRIADTLGVYTPSTLWTTISALRVSAPQLNLEFHGHNDFGMATANAFTALQLGISASSTVLGIGERAGNAALEQLVMACSYHQIEPQYNTRVIPKICNHIASACKLDIGAHQPIIGHNTRRHESGIHVSGMLKNPLAYEPFSPDMLGANNSEYIIGKHSGKTSIQAFAQKHGYNDLSELQLHTLLQKAKALSFSLGRNLEDSEVLNLIAESNKNQVPDSYQAY